MISPIPLYLQHCLFQKCCYSRNSTLATLISSGASAGYIYTSNPLHNPREANVLDEEPHGYCCHHSNLCSEFLRLRYSDTCDLYQALTSGMIKIINHFIMFESIISVLVNTCMLKYRKPFFSGRRFPLIYYYTFMLKYFTTPRLILFKTLRHKMAI